MARRPRPLVAALSVGLAAVLGGCAPSEGEPNDDTDVEGGNPYDADDLDEREENE